MSVPWQDVNPGVTARHYSVLIAWMTEVCKDVSVSSATTFASVAMVLETLPKLPLDATSSLQTLGVTCIFLACKLHELAVPSLRSLVWYTAGASTEAAVNEMEHAVVACIPTMRLEFLDAILQRVGDRPPVKALQVAIKCLPHVHILTQYTWDVLAEAVVAISSDDETGRPSCPEVAQAIQAVRDAAEKPAADA